MANQQLKLMINHAAKGALEVGNQELSTWLGRGFSWRSVQALSINYKAQSLRQCVFRQCQPLRTWPEGERGKRLIGSLIACSGVTKKNGIAFALKNFRKCSSFGELTKKLLENSGYLLKSISCQPIPIAWSSLSRKDSGSMRNSGHTRAFDRNNKYARYVVFFLTPWRKLKIENRIFPVLPSMRLVIQKLIPGLPRLDAKLKQASRLCSLWLPRWENLSPIF